MGRSRKGSRDRGLFRPPRWKKYARIVTFKDPKSARKAAKKLLDKLEGVKSHA